MRGEGNHKIPGSFAPENMEKTGAERVKYSLACQHEDAISIKFVSYAQKCPTVLCTFASLSARRAWIEIIFWICRMFNPAIALRKESVDRNRLVAGSLITLGGVALRKESVDRNFLELLPWGGWGASLYARRAWIEILHINGFLRGLPKVALRKESVDRNNIVGLSCLNPVSSLSARRAWIEISYNAQ